MCLWGRYPMINKWISPSWVQTIWETLVSSEIELGPQRTSLVAQVVENLPAMQETQVHSLDREDPLEEEMTTHSGCFAWRIPMDRGPWWATHHRVPKSQTQLSDWHTHTLGPKGYRSDPEPSPQSKCMIWGFPGCLVVNPQRFQCREHRFNPWSRN